MDQRAKDTPTKHLARNVPQNFSDLCARMRLMLFSGKTQGHSPRAYERLHRELLSDLSDSNFSQEQKQRISDEIDNIHVRFLVVQKTLDQSVPAKPIFMALKSLSKTLGKTIQKIDDPDRDEAVQELSDRSAMPTEVPNNFAVQIQESQSMAEKVTLLRQYLLSLADELDPIVEFFDYKGGLVTKGQPSKYAVLFAVFALADLFERENTHGAKAQVNEFERPHDPELLFHNTNQRRYTGKFLDFCRRFFSFVVPEQVDGRVYEAFADHVRKHARARTGDADIARLLLDDPVPVEAILEFMTRADALK